MVSRDYILWEVDTQMDFMMPGGHLYVPGAEKLLPNIRRLTDLARENRVFLVSHGCFHVPNDPEFKIFPPHCVKGTSGAEFVPEAQAAGGGNTQGSGVSTYAGELSSRSSACVVSAS